MRPKHAPESITVGVRPLHGVVSYLLNAINAFATPAYIHTSMDSFPCDCAIDELFVNSSHENLLVLSSNYGPLYHFYFRAAAKRVFKTHPSIEDRFQMALRMLTVYGRSTVSLLSLAPEDPIFSEILIDGGRIYTSSLKSEFASPDSIVRIFIEPDGNIFSNNPYLEVFEMLSNEEHDNRVDDITRSNAMRILTFIANSQNLTEIETVESLLKNTVISASVKTAIEEVTEMRPYYYRLENNINNLLVARLWIYVNIIKMLMQPSLECFLAKVQSESFANFSTFTKEAHLRSHQEAFENSGEPETCPHVTLLSMRSDILDERSEAFDEMASIIDRATTGSGVDWDMLLLELIESPVCQDIVVIRDEYMFNTGSRVRELTECMTENSIYILKSSKMRPGIPMELTRTFSGYYRHPMIALHQVLLSDTTDSNAVVMAPDIPDWLSIPCATTGRPLTTGDLEVLSLACATTLSEMFGEEPKMVVEKGPVDRWDQMVQQWFAKRLNAMDAAHTIETCESISGVLKDIGSQLGELVEIAYEEHV